MIIHKILFIWNVRNSGIAQLRNFQRNQQIEFFLQPPQNFFSNSKIAFEKWHREHVAAASKRVDARHVYAFWGKGTVEIAVLVQKDTVITLFNRLILPALSQPPTRVPPHGQVGILNCLSQPMPSSNSLHNHRADTHPDTPQHSQNLERMECSLDLASDPDEEWLPSLIISGSRRRPVPSKLYGWSWS